jgi:type IV pilus assembly protein PilB
VQPKQLAAVLVGSLSQRLVRRLCPKCREEIPPPEQFLARVRMTAEQLPHIYKASPEGCRLCCGSGFFGRTAVFELASGELIRRGIAAGAAADQLRQAAVKDGMRLLRDAGIQLVIDGVTSIEEVQRALAAPASGSAPASKAPASGRPAAPPPKRPAP